MRLHTHIVVVVEPSFFLDESDLLSAQNQIINASGEKRERHTRLMRKKIKQISAACCYFAPRLIKFPCSRRVRERIDDNEMEKFLAHEALTSNSLKY
jgi:hypothetical protein